MTPAAGGRAGVAGAILHDRRDALHVLSLAQGVRRACAFSAAFLASSKSLKAHFREDHPPGGQTTAFFGFCRKKSESRPLR